MQNDVDRIKRKAQRSKSAGCISSHDFKQGRNLTNVSLVRDVGSWLSERTAKIIQVNCKSLLIFANLCFKNLMINKFSYFFTGENRI